MGKGEIPVDVPENFTLHELMAKIKSEKQIMYILIPIELRKSHYYTDFFT